MTFGSSKDISTKYSSEALASLLEQDAKEVPIFKYHTLRQPGGTNLRFSASAI